MSDIAQKSLETLFIRILNQAASVIISVLLARSLGAYGKGLFTYVGTVLTVLLTFGAGQTASIAWQYGRLRRPSGDVARAMWKILAYASIPIAIGLIIIAIEFSTQRSLLYVSIAFPFALLSQMTLGFYLADGKVRIANIQSLFGSLGLLVVLIPIFFLLHLSLGLALVAWLCSFIVSGLYSAAMLKPYMLHNELTANQIVKEQAVFGLKASSNSLVALLNFRIDVFIILFTLGPKELGIYSIAIGFGELMWQLSRPIAISAFGRVNSGSKVEAAELTAKCTRHAIGLVTAGCLILYFVAPALITLVYGKSFSAAGPALRFLLPGIVAYSLTPFFASYFSQQLGRPGLQTLILGVSATICAIGTLATVRSLGIIGAALATSISYVVALALSLTIFSKETGIPINDMVVPRLSDLSPYASIVAGLKRKA